MLLRLAFSCLLMPSLAACRAFEASRCSAPDIVDTVKSLSNQGSDNPLAAVLLKLANTTFSLDAIRTVSSSSNETICEGRLTIRSQVPPPTPPPLGSPAPPQTAADQQFREQMQQQATTKVSDITYKLERTDDGQTYVSIIPSEADVLEQQNLQQQEQNRQSEEHQREERQFEQDDQQYEQEQRNR